MPGKSRQRPTTETDRGSNGRLYFSPVLSAGDHRGQSGGPSICQARRSRPILNRNRKNREADVRFVGELFRQIQNGAHFDRFFSPNPDDPKELEAAGLTEPGSSVKAEGATVRDLESGSGLCVTRIAECVRPGLGSASFLELAANSKPPGLGVRSPPSSSPHG